MADRLIVTGGAGFIGSCFVRLARKEGYDVTVIDALTYAGNEANLEEIRKSITFHKANIADEDAMKHIVEEAQPRAILNFAAETHVDNSISYPRVFLDANISGVFTLLEVARNYYKSLSGDAKEQFRYVQISTDEVYGSLGAKGHFTEASPYKPNSPYSASKAAGDHLARAWHKTYKLPTITTQCSNNYGPRQHPEKLIPHMISRALSGQSLPIYGDGKNVRDWIHVEDHCRGLLLAMEKGKPGDVFAFGGRAEKSNIDLVEQLCKHLDELRPRGDGLGHAEAIAFVPDRPGHDRRYAIDDTKAQDVLGFTREYDFKKGLRATVEWYLNNEDWIQSVTGKSAKEAA